MAKSLGNILQGNKEQKTTLNLVNACKEVQIISEEATALSYRRFLKLTFANTSRKSYSLSCDQTFFKMGKFFSHPGLFLKMSIKIKLSTNI